MRQFRLDGKALREVVHPSLEEFDSKVEVFEPSIEGSDHQPTLPTPRRAGQMYALYGNVVLRRSRCPECGDTSFVLDGVSACCHATIDFETSRSRRMSDARDRRKGPSQQRKREIRELQEECCFYCGRRFGSYVYRGFNLVWLRVHFDHVVAYAYSRNNYSDNFVAACHICNGLKGSKMFETVDQAKAFLLLRWEKKGIRDELS
ncbi:MAG: HNH endonuclease [Candidatus Thermoplasmatota archaeon]|nr:HNH endonuclease [Candidatus Thermoplasmatota archaeon]